MNGAVHLAALMHAVPAAGVAGLTAGQPVWQMPWLTERSRDMMCVCRQMGVAGLDHELRAVQHQQRRSYLLQVQAVGWVRRRLSLAEFECRGRGITIKSTAL